MSQHTPITLADLQRVAHGAGITTGGNWSHQSLMIIRRRDDSLAIRSEDYSEIPRSYSPPTVISPITEAELAVCLNVVNTALEAAYDDDDRDNTIKTAIEAWLQSLPPGPRADSVTIAPSRRIT